MTRPLINLLLGLLENLVFEDGDVCDGFRGNFVLRLVIVVLKEGVKVGPVSNLATQSERLVLLADYCLIQSLVVFITLTLQLDFARQLALELFHLLHELLVRV